MRKLLFFMAIVIGTSIQAQKGEFNVGVNAGLPVGDISDIYSFTLGAEVNYLFDIADKFKAGPSVAFINFFGKEQEVFGLPLGSIGDAQFLPIAAAARYEASDKFSIGADIGYGVGISQGNEGGFYYRPMVSYDVADNIAIQASFNGMSNDVISMNNIGLGVLFSL